MSLTVCYRSPVTRLRARRCGYAYLRPARVTPEVAMAKAKKVITVRLDQQHLATLRRVMDRYRCTLSQAIRIVIEDYSYAESPSHR